MIQLQNLHICIVYAKWEEKNREANRREATQEDTSASSAAQPRKGGRKASKEERIMLATLLSEPNKVPQVISSVLCGEKKRGKD
jgi:hypothetical protein